MSLDSATNLKTYLCYSHLSGRMWTVHSGNNKCGCKGWPRGNMPPNAKHTGSANLQLSEIDPNAFSNVECKKPTNLQHVQVFAMSLPTHVSTKYSHIALMLGAKEILDGHIWLTHYTLMHETM